MVAIGYILTALVFLWIGINLGVRAKLKLIENKKQEIKDLMDELKSKNNEMLSNLSKVAHVVSHTEGQWTDTDEFLMSMWME